MPTYRYKGLGCNKYYEIFVPQMTPPEEDLNENSPCECSIHSCVRVRVISTPCKPMGFKAWAGDWYKKTYGHDIGERDLAYASEQADLDAQVKELKRDHGISTKEPTEGPK